MRVNTCRCVAKESEIAVAKIIDTREGDTLVCSYHRAEIVYLNLMAERKIGVWTKQYEIVNLESNTIYL